MSFNTGIELTAGPTHGLQLARLLLGLLGLYALMSSPAQPQWLAAASVVLALTFFGLSRFTGDDRGATTLRLFPDGSAAIRTARGITHGQRCDGSWSSRLCSVLVLREAPGERRMRFLICRSANAADDYRRLLVCLRTGEPEGRYRVGRWL